MKTTILTTGVLIAAALAVSGCDRTNVTDASAGGQATAAPAATTAVAAADTAASVAPAATISDTAAPAPAEVLTPAAPASPRQTASARSDVYRPSFNCDNARSHVERMICSDQVLAAADRENAAAYARARRHAAIRDDALDGQRGFLGERNKCEDRQCVLDSYSNWTDELRGMTREQEMIGQ